MYNIKEVLSSPQLLSFVGKQLFDAIDVDASGRISEDELHTVLCSLAEDFGYEKPSTNESQDILEMIDNDRSGLIDLEEFTRLFKKLLKAVRDDDENKKKKKLAEEDEDEDEEEF